MTSNDASALRDLTVRTLFPGEKGFAEQHAGWNLTATHSPAVVVIPTCAQDVAEAVRHAARARLPVAVQATGHGVSLPADGAVFINTGQLTELSVDPDSRTARVGAGLRWGEVVAQTATAGLAPLNGSAPGVGVMGYLTGGGLPVLGRRFGFAADHVRSMQVVTADGDVRSVSPSADTDLFWAIRGGKSNFGVVTTADIDLVPMTRLYGGGLFFSGAQAETVLRRYLAWLPEQPEDMCSSMALLRFPDSPALPDQQRARLLIHLRIVYTGPAEEGEQRVAPLRALGPERDTVAEMPYTRIGEVYGEPTQPTPAWSRATVLRSIDAAAADALLDIAGPAASLPPGSVEIRHLGGALSRPATRPGAFGRPQGEFLLSMSMPAPAQAAAASHDAQLAILNRLAEWDTGTTLPNFMSTSDTTTADVRRGYTPADYQRLTLLKAAYDPDNIFRINHNIPPAKTV
ncbi:FAD-binding oxidoreductase [Nocardia sp. NPDC101769]|uniref:FAD-binding oxidoreductase n=1 Tax=Nocardia sp. NPDC101769 TaxID=3364333 RepID=UPI0038094B92